MSNPSPAVVRSILAKHAPKLLEIMDAAKDKFSAKLVHLKVPAAKLTLGSSRYEPDAVERDFIPWIPNSDTVIEAKEWARQKAAARESARGKPRKRTRAA